MKSVMIKDVFTDKDVEIKIGDWVGFKCDIEQSGKVIQIKRGLWGDIELVLEDENGFIGEYIGGETKTVVRLKDIWVD